MVAIKEQSSAVATKVRIQSNKYISLALYLFGKNRA